MRCDEALSPVSDKVVKTFEKVSYRHREGMPVLGTPKYPVIDPDPTMVRALTNMNFTDMGYLLSLPIVGAAAGYLTGKR